MTTSDKQRAKWRENKARVRAAGQVRKMTQRLKGLIRFSKHDDVASAIDGLAAIVRREGIDSMSPVNPDSKVKQRMQTPGRGQNWKSA